MTTTFASRRPIPTADLLETRLRAPAALRPWFTEAARIPTVTELTGPFTHVPQAATTIVLREQVDGRRDALVLGPQTRARYSAADKPAGCTRLRLAPGAARPLLGVPAVDLTDRVVRLADLPGVAADLADELTRLASGDLLAFLAAELPRRVREDPTQRAHRGLLGAAASALSATTPVREVADALAVSERQLRNLFTAGVGISPKHFARIGRVRRVLAEAGRASLAEIAADSGYYDQSHMSADFRTLMGVPPASFLRGDLPPATPCGAMRTR